MQIKIAAVGRLRRGPALDLFNLYKKRLPWSLDVIEIEDKRGGDAKTRRRREAERLIAALPENAVRVALDEHGRSLTSEKFAALFTSWQNDNRQTVAFLIGGADGLDPSITEAADLVLAFGSMTWPHMLARAMLAEQVYRAYTMLTGHPYHRA